MDRLEELREKISTLDRQLNELFKDRLDIVKEIALYKKDNNLQVEDLKREKEILDQIDKDSSYKTSFLKLYYQYIIELAKEYQNEELKENSFIKVAATKERLFDPVFKVAKKAKEDTSLEMINATLGVLVGEDGVILAFNKVYEIFNKLDDYKKAGYAQSIMGNEEYLKAVEKWVLPKGLKRYSASIATSGGTGAVYLAITSTLDKGQTLILPDLAWTSYQVMAQENKLEIVYYSYFNEDLEFDLTGLLNKIIEVSKYQRRITVVINDPAHNPSGYCLKEKEWEEIIDLFNSLDNEIVLINDIAYMDFARDKLEELTYIKMFDNLKTNTLVIMAFSASKSLSMYGLRLGAAIVLGETQAVDNMMLVFEREARAIWSNVNNGAMQTLSEIYFNNLDEYLDEKDKYRDLLVQRSKLFIQEANEVGLTCYHYVSGFFITVACKDNRERDLWFETLMEKHIYLVVVEKGLRVAICGLPLNKIAGLSKLIKEAKPET